MQSPSGLRGHSDLIYEDLTEQESALMELTSLSIDRGHVVVTRAQDTTARQ